jgi:aminoglycoside phosphotransferase (APT) family kinase protein
MASRVVQDSILPKIQLPYFRNPDQLPCPLPTTKEIKAGRVIHTYREFYADHGHVVIVGDCFVVKYGPYTRENEGYALLLLEKYPSIPAPQLYAMYREDEVLYLVMQLIPGRDLLNLWHELSENEKVFICGQLKEAFTHIRSIPSPGIFGDTIGGPLPHRLFDWSANEDPRISGPFKTLEDFHLSLALHSQKHKIPNHWSSEWFARHLPRVMKDHPSTFTHSDLIKENILVQEQLGTDGQTDRQFKVTGIVDWAMAGWYPRYWEYAVFFTDALWNGAWEAKFETFIDPWPLEAALLRLVMIDIEDL